MKYTVEKGIPIPTGKGPAKNPLTDVLEKMSVKESVLVTDQNRGNVSAVVTRVMIRTGRTFKTRTVTAEAGIRIWRVS